VGLDNSGDKNSVETPGGIQETRSGVLGSELD
jgi:hypothetical protein